MSEAVGVHNHPTLKLGRRPPSNKPALMLAKILSGIVPAHLPMVDHLGKLAFGMYGNDQYGVCGPTSVANLIRLVSYFLTGSEVQVTQEDVFALYRLSGNPNFDPATDADDNGVDMQTMLEALLEHGIGGHKPLAFAKVDVSSDAELDAAVAIFGGLLWGVGLMVAQQQQTDAKPPKWDYHASGEWGGHAIVNGEYDEKSADAQVISWAQKIDTTATFRRHQLEEAWVVVWPWNIDHPSFQAGVDVAAMKVAFKELTGKDLIVPDPSPTPIPAPPVPPAPRPTPEPAEDVDKELWAAVTTWAHGHHIHPAHEVAKAILTWGSEKGFT